MLRGKKKGQANSCRSTHATDGHISLCLVLYHMDLIGQKQASWDLQQSPVREEEGVQKGLLEPPPLSQVNPLLHTLNHPPFILPWRGERRRMWRGGTRRLNASEWT